MELRFRLELQTDYHIGTGHGIGSQVDSALLRDGDGVPAVRGHTLEGLLRDGMRRLLTMPPLRPHWASHTHAEQQRRAAGGSEAAAYCTDVRLCPLCRIFGTPAAPKRWYVSSARPVGMQTPMQDRGAWQAGQTGAQVAARVRVSPRMRRAEAHKLFKQEEGDRRLTFAFTLTCHTDDEVTRDEAALLVGAARMVRRFGSARRRGRGECVLHLIHAVEETAWLGHFKEHWLTGQTGQPATLVPTPDLAWTHPVSTGGQPVRWRIIVRTDEPVIIARRAEAGNLFDGLGYINGSTFWGAVAHHAADTWHLRHRDERFYQESSVYQAFRELLLHGRVRCLPLYPAYTALDFLYPTVPTPLDLLTCKVYPGFALSANDIHHHGAEGYARHTSMPHDCPRCRTHGHPDVPLVAVGGFVPVKPIRERTQDYTPRRRDELHPRINPYTQRVATGDLFGYVALESGQYFIGEMWCQDEGAWQALCALTGVLKAEGAFVLRLGKATRRGYGLVTVWMQPMDESVDLWCGISIAERLQQSHDPITLTLLSDAIIPDAWGRFRQTLDDPQWLEDLLNTPFTPHTPFQLERHEGRPSSIRAFCKAGAVDSFNNTLGLPRWRDIAIKAGSAVSFRVMGMPMATALQERLRHIEQEGIGLRRHEGFGCVAFNHPIYDGGMRIVDAGIEVPESLRLASASAVGSAAALHSEFDFIRTWLRDLRDESEFEKRLFHEDKWEAVARWLWNAADQPIATLQASLKRFGDPKVLTDVWREPKDHFTGKAGQAMAHLDAWLQRAAGLSEPLRRMAVQLLADHVAAAVVRKEQ